MRISPVTGDLPAVASAPPVPRPATEVLPAPAPTVVARADVSSSDADATTDRRRTPTLQPFFDPPLIAQRAVLGLPVGSMIADFARTSGITWMAASAAVDRELEQQGS